MLWRSAFKRSRGVQDIGSGAELSERCCAVRGNVIEGSRSRVRKEDVREVPSHPIARSALQPRQQQHEGESDSIQVTANGHHKKGAEGTRTASKRSSV